jgi:hypothetical protein
MAATTSGDNPFIASRKCVRDFVFMRILDAYSYGEMKVL